MSATTDGFPYPPASDALGNGYQWMQDMAEFLDAAWVPWTAYTPALTGVTLGNGLLEGMYRVLFDVVDFRVSLTLGTTTVITGAISLGLPAGLPAAETNAGFNGFPIGQVLGYDDSAPLYRVGLLVPDVGADKVFLNFDSGTNVASATIPFTWDDPDSIRAHGSYRTV